MTHQLDLDLSTLTLKRPKEALTADFRDPEVEQAIVDALRGAESGTAGPTAPLETLQGILEHIRNSGTGPQRISRMN